MRAADRQRIAEEGQQNRGDHDEYFFTGGTHTGSPGSGLLDEEAIPDRAKPARRDCKGLFFRDHTLPFCQGQHYLSRHLAKIPSS